jgi:transposase
VAVVDKDNERVVLCYSKNRAEKEKQILSQAEKRYLEDLEKLQKRVESGRLKSPEAIQRSLGKIDGRNSRVARYYEVKFEDDKLAWTRIDEKFNEAWQLSGGYHLRCSRKDLDDETIWKLYITLTRVESGFRALKSTLGLRPVFHQREDRCESHIFITILAYRLLHWIEYTLRQQGEARSWPSIKRTLQTHCYTTIVCPSEEGLVYHIRCPGVADPAQAILYQHLGVNSSKLPRKQTVL